MDRPRGIKFVHDNQRWIIDRDGKLYLWRITTRQWLRVTWLNFNETCRLRDAANAKLKTRKKVTV